MTESKQLEKQKAILFEFSKRDMANLLKVKKSHDCASMREAVRISLRIVADEVKTK